MYHQKGLPATAVRGKFAKPRPVILALRQYPQGGGEVESPSPLMETFAKLSGTAIGCSDSQSAKFDFPIDSRLCRNDGRFCKGLS